MRRLARAVLLAAVAIGGAACERTEAPPPPPPAPPNVILISIDTLRADRLNAYGYARRTVSPSIDALARDGVLFERHVSAAPWTTPSHMSLLTGLSPSAHGVTQSFSQVYGQVKKGGEGFIHLADEHETLAEALSAAGYTTAAFAAGGPMHGSIGFDQGFASYRTTPHKMNEETLAALASFVSARHERPFFLFWHTFETHAPYLQPAFLGEVLPLERAQLVQGDLERLAGQPGGELLVGKGQRTLMKRKAYTLDVCSALYDGGILSADRWVGRLVASLKAAGVYERTLIVVTSDHGEQLGETAPAGGSAARNGNFYNEHGYTLYEEILRVPLVLKLPGQLAAGKRVSAVSRAIDVMPTILDLAGARGGLKAQGASLRALWERGAGEAREAFSESLVGEGEGKSLRTARYKYSVTFDGEHVRRRGRAFIPPDPEMVELYDLVADPGETKNLLHTQASAAIPIAQRMDAELRRLARERIGKAAPAPLDPEALEQLKALGYVQ